MPLAQAAEPTTGLSGPEDREKFTREIEAEDETVMGVAFNKDDTWIVVFHHLSSGNYFSFYHRSDNGSYVEDKELGGTDEPVPGFIDGQKVPAAQIDRWTAGFEGWDISFGPAAFIFSFSARLTERGPDGSFEQFVGWRGVYDRQKKALVKILSQGRVFTRTELAEKELNDKYPELQALLEPSARSKLRLEEIEWLKKRDSIEDLRQKLEFTEARVAEFESRVAALKK